MAKAAGLEVVAAGWGHSVQPVQALRETNTKQKNEGCEVVNLKNGVAGRCVVLLLLASFFFLKRDV